MPHLVAYPRDDAQHPDGSGDAYPPGIAQFATNEIAERGRLIHLAVAQEILAARLSFFTGKKHGLNHILHIDKGDVLLLVAHSEVAVLLDALGHQEIVTLTRAIDSRRTQNNIRE